MRNILYYEYQILFINYNCDLFVIHENLSVVRKTANGLLGPENVAPIVTDPARPANAVTVSGSTYMMQC